MRNLTIKQFLSMHTDKDKILVNLLQIKALIKYILVDLASMESFGLYVLYEFYISDKEMVMLKETTHSSTH